MSRLHRLVGRVRGRRAERPATDATGFYGAAAPRDGRRGEVLAVEPIDADGGERRVRYRTVDASGRPVAASMAVGGTPAGSGTDRPIVVWVHGAVGVAPGCGPSRRGLDVPFAAELRRGGVVVVAPDLTGLGVEGVHHPYLHGTTAGRAVLDAARAAEELPGAGSGSRVALAGHSAGGHAVLWANQLADEDGGQRVDLRTVLAIAPIGDLAVAMHHYATTPGHGAFAVQVAATWPRTEPVDAAEVLTSAARRRTSVLDSECLGGVLEVYRGDPSHWVRADGFRTGGWSRALVAQSAGQSRGPAPVVVVHGADDGSVLPTWSEQLVDDIRRAGGTAELRLHRGADHSGVLDSARDEILRLLLDALTAAPG